ncbi:MAG: hypothetical protein ACK4MQ_03580 [Hyphomonas sp.]
MKLRLPAAIVMSLALPAFALPATAIAQEAPSPFRSVEAQSFSATDLQRYGLTDAQVAEVQAYQAAGYDIQVMSPEEAEEYTAGISTNNVLAIIGLVAIIVVIASVV